MAWQLRPSPVSRLNNLPPPRHPLCNVLVEQVAAECPILDNGTNSSASDAASHGQFNGSTRGHSSTLPRVCEARRDSDDVTTTCHTTPVNQLVSVTVARMSGEILFGPQEMPTDIAEFKRRLNESQALPGQRYKILAGDAELAGAGQLPFGESQTSSLLLTYVELPVLAHAFTFEQGNVKVNVSASLDNGRFEKEFRRSNKEFADGYGRQRLKDMTKADGKELLHLLDICCSTAPFVSYATALGTNPAAAESLRMLLQSPDGGKYFAYRLEYQIDGSREAHEVLVEDHHVSMRFELCYE